LVSLDENDLMLVEYSSRQCFCGMSSQEPVPTTVLIQVPHVKYNSQKCHTDIPACYTICLKFLKVGY